MADSVRGLRRTLARSTDSYTEDGDSRMTLARTQTTVVPALIVTAGIVALAFVIHKRDTSHKNTDPLLQLF